MTEKEVPAIDITVAMNVGASAQVTLRTFIDRNADDASANLILDKMFRLAERQKARADIEDLEREIRQHQVTQEQFEKAFQETRHRKAAEKVTRDTQVEEYLRQIADLTGSSEDAWIKSGRHGTYAPKGQTKHNIDVLQGQIEKIKADQVKSDEDDEQYLKQVEDARVRFREEVTSRQNGIAKRLEMIGGAEHLRKAAE